MRRIISRLVVSIAIGALMLYLAGRHIEFSGTWRAMATAKWWVLLPYFAVMAIQHVFRVWRWGFLLAPIQSVPFSRLLPVSSVGFFAILALPLRMGELVRPYLIAEPPNLRVSHGLGTMAVERVFDGLVLSLTAFAAISAARSWTEVPRWLGAAGGAALSIFCLGLVILTMTLWQRERAVAICRRLTALISERLADKAAGIARGIVDGFRVLPDWRRLLPFVAGTLAYWLGNGAAIWVLSYGFDMRLSLFGSLATVSLIGIGIMIPAGPAFIGNFELFADGALGLYAPTRARVDRGAAFILAAHATNAMWYIFAGLLGLMSAHVSLRDIRTATDKTASDGV